MTSVFDHYFHYLSSLNMGIDDVIFTGSQFLNKATEESDYDFIIVFKSQEDIEYKIHHLSELKKYSRYPVDLIYTTTETLLNLSPLHGHSGVLNNIRLEGLSQRKINLPPFDPEIFKLTTLKLLIKNITINQFKNERHFQKTLGLYGLGKTLSTELIQHELIHTNYEDIFKKYSPIHSINEKLRLMEETQKDLLVTSFQSDELKSLFGIDPIFMEELNFQSSLNKLIQNETKKKAP